MNKFMVFTLLISGTLASSCKHKENADDPINESFVLSDTMLNSTTFATADSARLKNVFNFYGTISADNNKLIEVYPVVGGIVLKVYAELGDYVNKGQLLATLRSPEVAEFEKELQDAQSDLIVARNNYKVALELFEGKLNSDRDVLTAKSGLEKAESRLKQIQQTFEIYSLKPGSIYEVRSPISGFIIQKNINQDMQLRSDRTDNIFDVAEIDDVWAIANVNESDIGLIKTGMDAAVTTLSYPDKVFKGKVDKIFNIIDPDTKAMKVRINLPNPDYLLKPEMRASIVITSDENKSMLAVPSEALIFDKSKNYVMVFKDRYNIETREVDIFRQVGNEAYIDRGLQDGEKVITQNQLLIYDALND
jgi:membrane fusion protein, heavy metal efflux system